MNVTESKLIQQKQLYEKRLDKINSSKMEILEALIENENTEEEIEQQLRCTIRQLKRSGTDSLR